MLTKKLGNNYYRLIDDIGASILFRVEGDRVVVIQGSLILSCKEIKQYMTA